ncbi:MAG: LLM class F420-dependent oxidoreductase [Actinomycetales bacterium]
MDFRVFVEPQQGASYDDLLRVAQHAEELGFDGFFRSDHYLFMGEWAAHGHAGEPGPTDAWTTLAGLARETTRLRLGTLVTSATFRLPGILAIQVAGVDAMSGGRVELGLGAGWFAEEHEAYGIPFPETPERFDRLEEQLAIVTGLWGTPPGERFSYDGKHYQLFDSPALPKPVQSPPPVIVGGHGKRRTPALAARYAAEFNVGFSGPREVSGLFAGARSACADIERDPDDLVMSVAHILACGATEADVNRRAADANGDAASLRDAEAFAGSPAEVVERIGQFAEIGATRFYLQLNGLADLGHLDLVAAEVVPQLR